MIELRTYGSFKNVEKWLDRMSKDDIFSALDRYGRAGVDALRRHTPMDTGLTAASWTYEVRKTRRTYSIVWHNTNINNGVPIAIILQYGHGTGTGGYVAGRDYINPAIQPIFDQIANDVWREVTK